MSYQIIIATRDPQLAGRLEQLASVPDRAAFTINTASDRKSFFALVKNRRPDIIIMDACFDDGSGISLLRQAQESASLCHTILIADSQDFQTAYQAIQNHIEYFFVFPADEARFSLALQELRKHFGLHAPDFSEYESRKIIGKLFLDRGRITLQDNLFSVDIVNNLYDTAFRDDSYRMLVIRMNADMPSPEPKLRHLMDVCIRNLYSQLSPCCHEIVMRFAVKRVHVFINYSETEDSAVKEILNRYSRSAEALLPAGYSLTLYSSRPCRNIQDVGRMAEEAMDTLWTNFNEKSGLFFPDDTEETLPPYIQQMFSSIEQDLKRACYELNASEFQRITDRFFAMPAPMIKLKESRHLIRRVEFYMFEINRDLISSYTDINLARQNILRLLQSVSSLDEYTQKYADCMLELFQNILDQIGGQQSKYIRLAQQYIKTHLSDHISLKDVAGSVNLSQVYLSSLFKKETGCSFTDFINQCRVEKAKEMLRDPSVKIHTVASSLAYCDSRYFSKIFKSITGMKPSEYRNYISRSPKSSTDSSIDGSS